MELNQESKKQASEPGKIITFYSYKGGTGRSMALANVACLLAQSTKGDKGILVVDWDLEAPGLHKFFRDRLTRELGAGPEIDAKLDAHPGLIDLFYKLNDKVRSFKPGLDEPDEEIESSLRKVANLDELILKTDIPSLHLLKAGRFDDHYPALISTFPWVNLYTDYTWLFSLFADWLAERYQYVLIDSRTGDTDTSNICTMILPEKLVAVFTPNNQSLIGVLRILKRAFGYRKRSEDVRPLMVYPLPSRIDAEEPDRRDSWRYGDSKLGIPGYQPEFEKLFNDVYGMSECSLEKYFKEVQIQHTSRYAYGEEIAILIERSRDRLSLSHAFEDFTERLISHLDPWEDKVKTQNGADADVESLISRAESVLAGLTPSRQDLAQEVFTRLVRLPAPGEGSKPSALRISAEEFSAPARKLVDTFTEERLLTKEADSNTGTEVVSLEKEELLTHWWRLKEWLDKDQNFLLWRQQLRSAITDWVISGRNNHHLLRGKQLSLANKRLAELGQDFNSIENEFIWASNTRQRIVRRATVAGIIAIGLILSVISNAIFYQYKVYQMKRDLGQWRLPSDLYDYQYQLNSLTVRNYQIAYTEWIKGDLKEVTLKLGNLRNLDTLPTSITQLSLSSTRSIDLTGIEKLTNLTTLDLSDTGLTDLAGIEKLTKLSTLNLNRTGLSSLAGIEKLTNLTTLDLSVTRLTILAALENLTNLTNLNLGNTRLNSLAGVEKLNNLTTLDLSGNRELVDLSGIEKLTHLTNLNLSDTGLSSLGGIEKLNNLTTLNLSGTRLTNPANTENRIDLSGLEKLSRLSTLNLRSTGLTNLASIQKLTNLTTLNLSGNKQLANLDGIEKLTNLTTLDLSDTQLNSLDGIEKLTNLTTLNLSDTRLTNLVALENLTNLTDLNLRSTGLSSLAGIEKLNNLTTLDLSGTLLTSLANIENRIDLTRIEKLSKLSTLNLSDTGLNSLDRVEKLTNLTSLDLSRTELTNLAGIEKLTNLTTLNLSDTLLYNVEGLEKCAGLTTLDITGLTLTTLKGLPKSVEKLSLGDTLYPYFMRR